MFLSLPQARNIRLVSEAATEDEDFPSEGLGELLLDGLSSENPHGARLSVDDQGRLSWPVLFLYPEYAQSDFISAFHEDSRYLTYPKALCFCLLAVFLLALQKRQVDFWLRREENKGF